ncbi:MAG: 5-formyltetrahydrofolate cyclo-ligase [Actinomycetota bacterium]|nr:MAG: 5-formyltetrahydrofolate cyclo-ligase [Actinomycetota bacterium]
MTGADDLGAAKRALRRAVLERRDAIPPSERARAAAAIVRAFLDLPELEGARRVMAFVSFGSEVPTGGLLEALRERGAEPLVPRLAGGEIEAVPWSPAGPMRRTAFGALEPIGVEPVDPGTIDAVAVPGVAFDPRGGRVGYGGGYYDRFTRRLRVGVPRIALAFDLQVVETVPEGPDDGRVDLIVTERRVLRCALSTG